MKILLVEDDESLVNLLQAALERQQYQVDVAIDGQDGWELAEVFPYDLILLDLMLPRLDGINFCKRLRASAHFATQQPNQATPVLLMTAIDAVTNKIMGLDAGADDYVVKPLNLEELQARIRALDRRGRLQRSPLLEWEGLRLQPKNCEVTYLEKPVILTLKEYQLLELLLRHPNQIFSQGRLIEHLWGQDETPTENAVRAQIKGLRHKLKQVGAEDVIETIYKLGYRLKKRDGDNCRQAESDIMAASVSPQSSIPPEIRQVWEACRESYLDRVVVLEEAVTALQARQMTAQLRQQTEREAHTLIGSLGSFGLDQASQLSRQIQQLFRDPTLEHSKAQQLSQLLKELRQEIEGEAGDTETAPPILTPTAGSSASLPTLLIVDDDAALAHCLATEAISWGMQTTIATHLAQARKLILKQTPDIVLLDLTLSDPSEQGLNFLAELQNWYPDIPVLAFTARDSLSDRVQAARLGSKGFLQKPIVPAQVLATVAQTLQQTQQTLSKLLIVDDDPQLLSLLQQVLEPEGYALTLLDNAQQFWEVLEQSAPDLLILDVELQNCASPLLELSGFDLCRIIRNDPQWGKVPILFLSACTDPQVIQRGFEAGADDFLHKPIVPTELLTRIRKRLEQGQIRRQTEIDELTGVSNRQKSLQDLTRFLRLAQRQQQCFSLAVLDLDQFKQVNDQYGHEMGDRVLSYFGCLLKQSFRQEDVVGRWGGEEFIVGMYGMSKRDGVKRLTEMLQRLRQKSFTAGNDTAFQVTFSGGIAQLQEDGADLQTLYRVADAILYQAKASGRNQILTTE